MNNIPNIFEAKPKQSNWRGHRCQQFHWHFTNISTQKTPKYSAHFESVDLFLSYLKILSSLLWNINPIFFVRLLRTAIIYRSRCYFAQTNQKWIFLLVFFWHMKQPFFFNDFNSNWIMALNKIARKNNLRFFLLFFFIYILIHPRITLLFKQIYMGLPIVDTFWALPWNRLN